jgi:hypothetical protein
MLVTAGPRGLRPCDPRIYRFAASPVQGLRCASTPEASAARLRRVRPRNRRSGRIPALPYPPSGLDQSMPMTAKVKWKSLAGTRTTGLKRFCS